MTWRATVWKNSLEQVSPAGGWAGWAAGRDRAAQAKQAGPARGKMRGKMKGDLDLRADFDSATDRALDKGKLEPPGLEVWNVRSGVAESRSVI